MHMPYVGSGAYCFTNCLRMCLERAGMVDPPDVGWLECMTGMPFGATFWALDPPLFFPSPGTATDPDRGLTRALATIGWSCRVERFQDAGAARAALVSALATGPALVGPLDLGWLPYDPARAGKRGGDHFVVAWALDGDTVRVHDPQGYPHAVMSIAEIMRAWNAGQIRYAPAPYTFRADFHAERAVSPADVEAATLRTAREMMQDPPAGPVAHGGALAFARAAQALRGEPPDSFIGLLTYFALPLGARRSVDAAAVLERSGRGTAASLLVERARGYGLAQYHAASGEPKRAADALDRLARVEAELGVSL